MGKKRMVRRKKVVDAEVSMGKKIVQGFLVVGILLAVIVGLEIWQITRPPQVVEKVVEVTRVVKEVVTTTPVPTPTEVSLLKLKTPEPSELMETEVEAATFITVTPTFDKSEVNTITGTQLITQAGWTIVFYPGATEEMRSWSFRRLDPMLWKLFPNVDNGIYKASDGVEYGMAESIFCQRGKQCDIIVPARHYRLITGDYDTVFGKCAYGNDKAGCALLMVNVGNQTAVWRDQVVDAGFTVTGRYWNGQKLDQAIWALASHTAYNMLNLSGDQVNAGANCSSPSGCPKVKITVVVVSGNEMLMRMETLVSR